ncbi:brefeldin A-inhibited guanine nucleotide-exchange protein 5-like [Humulus lupulus]|uniref:brefeldin A-inhibited guanine nucleotide-exchange protein 5-like n=1 Tax=Humulus lupulus TaxID=3486 RepID=UPI002B4022C1|nr:brefeldin A-inhibited guanine nucleotide-exchange protein 5-like [Humulus lupulus]
MAGGAAGGFVTRAFESMLKECSGKKHPELQKAIQNYIDGTKEVNQVQPSASSETKKAASVAGDESSLEDGAAKSETEESQSQTVPHDAEAIPVAKPVSISATISTVLASAGNTLEGSVAELVLSPLRLAFETKNLKILESALDCLHVCICHVFYFHALNFIG